MSFTQFLLFEKKLPRLAKAQDDRDKLEATFTTSADRDVAVSFIRYNMPPNNTIIWEVLFDVDYAQMRYPNKVGDEPEILQGIMAYVDQFFKMNIDKDIIYFSGADFRAGPYEKLAKTLLWKRSKAKELYIKKGTITSNIFYVYTDKGTEYVKKHSDIKKVK